MYVLGNSPIYSGYYISDGAYFEIMGQWSGPTINLTADITVNSLKTHIPLGEETRNTENQMTVKQIISSRYLKVYEFWTQKVSLIKIILMR